ncbi:FkbM family methyltransferase [Nostoc sp.]|uniref:FkbM family methyltransferase n=1 Tax=Nostoc sp. TaxID=1180 RepID=UPI002FF595C3
MSFQNYLISLCPPQFRIQILFYVKQLRGSLDNEIKYLEDLVSKNRVAIDIGANKGLYSYALSKFCRVVHAFEPQPGTAEVIGKSRIDNIKINNVALSDTEGTLTLHIPIIRGEIYSALASFREPEGQHQDIEVPIKRLDDYNFQDVSFIKIDVEGHESHVIEGGRQTILREKPVLLVEIEQRHLGSEPIEVVFEKITDLGYEGWFLNQGKFFPLSQFSYEKYQKPFLEDDTKAIFSHKNRGKVNNFLFKPTKND